MVYHGRASTVAAERTTTTTAGTLGAGGPAHPLVAGGRSPVHQDEGTRRIESFSDGVFAIAVTLLVLHIEVPDPDEIGADQLAPALVALWPSYLAFALSFVTILVIWVRHHWMFTLIRRTDHAFLYWNGLLLFVITFLPFPTALLAAYLRHGEAKAAVVLYTGTVLAISLAFRGLWRHATRDRRLLELAASDSSRGVAVRITREDRLTPWLYGVAFAVSFVAWPVGLGLCLALSVLFAVHEAVTRT